MTSPSRSDWLARRIRVAVGQRLLLGLAPSLLALALVVALAYYGDLGRQAPEAIVGIAGALAVASLLITWWNTRYLVRRLRRLGRADAPLSDGSSLDDLDRIELEVQRLTTALAAAQREGNADHEQLSARLHEQATMLSATLHGALAQVDEVLLPLHILLDTRFGELNENQEELLVAARAGADAIDGAIRRLRIVSDADRAALAVRPEPVAPNDVVRAVLPMARATADRIGTTIDVNLEPALPRAWANRAALAEAFALVATTAIERMSGSQPLSITTLSSTAACLIRIRPIDASLLEEPLIIVAQRLLHAQQVSLQLTDASFEITLPRAL